MEWLGENMNRKVKKDNSSSNKKTKNNKVVVTEKLNFNSTKFKLYFSFRFRLAFNLIMFVCFFGLSIYLLFTSLSFQREKYINYNEKGSLDYKVNLKENSFYDTKVLDKNLIYVSSLIDSIDTYFNYDFNIDDKIDMDFDYSVVAKLRITDSEGSNSYLEKDYTLVNNKKVSMKNDNHINISEKVNIDYGYYNSIASGFKSTYGVDSKSNLIVSLKVNKSNSNVKVNNNSSVQVINIPLSERSINIKLDYIDINSNSSVVSEREISISNILYIVISVLLLVFSLYFILKFIRLLEKNIPKKNKFDKYVEKLLREYDRLIVESHTIIDFDNYEIIKVNNFNELLDVRDNLKVPINYFVVIPHQKAYFYIVSTNVYLYVVKEVDLGK